MGLIDSPLCRKCGAEDETSAHILCRCEALAFIRSQRISRIKTWGPSGALARQQGPLSDVWATKGQFKKRLGALGLKGPEPIYQPIYISDINCGPGTDYPYIHIFQCMLERTDAITKEVLEPITFFSVPHYI
jgi:hypothetical protein